MFSQVIFPTEELATGCAMEIAGSDMLRFDMAHQHSFTGECAAVFTVLPMALKRALKRAAIVTIVDELLLARSTKSRELMGSNN